MKKIKYIYMYLGYSFNKKLYLILFIPVRSGDFSCMYKKYFKFLTQDGEF